MTYFDREHELKESALSCIFDAIADSSELTLHTPTATLLQSGKSVLIMGFIKVNESTLLVKTETGTIPTLRLDTDSLMDLVDTQVLPALFSRN